MKELEKQIREVLKKFRCHKTGKSFTDVMTEKYQRMLVDGELLDDINISVLQQGGREIDIK